MYAEAANTLSAYEGYCCSEQTYYHAGAFWGFGLVWFGFPPLPTPGEMIIFVSQIALDNSGELVKKGTAMGDGKVAFWAARPPGNIKCPVLETTFNPQCCPE